MNVVWIQSHDQHSNVRVCERLRISRKSCRNSSYRLFAEWLLIYYYLQPYYRIPLVDVKRLSTNILLLWNYSLTLSTVLGIRRHLWRSPCKELKLESSSIWWTIMMFTRFVVTNDSSRWSDDCWESFHSFMCPTLYYQ